MRHSWGMLYSLPWIVGQAKTCPTCFQGCPRHVGVSGLLSNFDRDLSVLQARSGGAYDKTTLALGADNRQDPPLERVSPSGADECRVAYIRRIQGHEIAGSAHLYRDGLGTVDDAATGSIHDPNLDVGQVDARSRVNRRPIGYQFQSIGRPAVVNSNCARSVPACLPTARTVPGSLGTSQRSTGCRRSETFFSPSERPSGTIRRCRNWCRPRRESSYAIPCPVPVLYEPSARGVRGEIGLRPPFGTVVVRRGVDHRPVAHSASRR